MQSGSAAQPDQPPRPRGVSLTAIALASLVGAALLQFLLRLGGRTPAQLATLDQFAIVCVVSVVELLILWHYWRGKNWSRVLVLLWSFFIAARELSALIDHGSNLMSLMSDPVRFFVAILAAFLLYWLNTRPLRNWFKKMSSSVSDLLADHLVGKLCTEVDRTAGTSGNLWRFSFEHDAELRLRCPWRIVLDDNLAFASNSPTEAGDEEEEVRRLVLNLRVHALSVTPRTSDLFIAFEMGIELQTWSSNGQSQQWEFADPTLAVAADSAELSMQSKPFPDPADD